MQIKKKTLFCWGVLTALMLGLNAAPLLAAETAIQEKFAIEIKVLDEEVRKAKETSDQSAAIKLQEQILELTVNVYGEGHLDTALALNNLARSFSDLGQHDRALPLQLRGLAIREKVLGPEHPATALALNNLAMIYSGLSQYDRALPLQLRVLAIMEKVVGPENSLTALALNNLAGTVRAHC